MLTMARGPTSTLKLDGSGETPKKVVSCCSASSGCSTRSSKRSSKKDLGGRPNSAMEPELSWCRGGAPKRPAGPGQPWLYSGAPEYPGRELEGASTSWQVSQLCLRLEGAFDPAAGLSREDAQPAAQVQSVHGVHEGREVDVAALALRLHSHAQDLWRRLARAPEAVAGRKQVGRSLPCQGESGRPEPPGAP